MCDDWTGTIINTVVGPVFVFSLTRKLQNWSLIDSTEIWSLTRNKIKHLRFTMLRKLIFLTRNILSLTRRILTQILNPGNSRPVFFYWVCNGLRNLTNILGRQLSNSKDSTQQRSVARYRLLSCPRYLCVRTSRSQNMFLNTFLQFVCVRRGCCRREM